MESEILPILIIPEVFFISSWVFLRMQRGLFISKRRAIQMIIYLRPYKGVSGEGFASLLHQYHYRDLLRMAGGRRKGGQQVHYSNSADNHRDIHHELQTRHVPSKKEAVKHLTETLLLPFLSFRLTFGGVLHGYRQEY